MRVKRLKKAFFVELMKEKDGSIRECNLKTRQEEDKEWRYVLTHITKRELEYLIWILADARNDMRYTKEQPRLFYDLQVKGLIVRIGRKAELEGCPPPEPFPRAHKG
jgi:hypothetical protein